MSDLVKALRDRLEWKEIKTAPGYWITSSGNVESRRRRDPRILKPQRTLKGYLRVGLIVNGRFLHKLIGRLVLETFVGPAPKGTECSHLDGNPLNNNLDNLVWETRVQNNRRKSEHGTKLLGKLNPKTKLTVADVIYIRKNYHLCDHNTSNLTSLAQQFGVSRTTVWRALIGFNWGHIKE